MDVSIVEENGKAIISPSERNHTLMTVLKQAVWDVGGKAGYNQGHPYEGESGELVVEADDPTDTVEEAIEAVREELDEFRDAFSDA